jgi:hypothetical protein
MDENHAENMQVKYDPLPDLSPILKETEHNDWLQQ